MIAALKHDQYPYEKYAAYFSVPSFPSSFYDQVVQKNIFDVGDLHADCSRG